MKSFKTKSFIYKSTAISIVAVSLLFYQNCSKPFVAQNPVVEGALSQASSGVATAPTLLIQSSPNSITNSNSASITYSAQAGNGARIVSIRCTLDALAPVDCMQGFNRIGLTDGNHILRIIATDSAGVTSREQMVTWVVDTTAPTVSFQMAPAENATVSTSSVNMTFSQPSDASGISSVSCSYGNSLANISSNVVNCANRNINLSGLSSGPIFVRVRVLDMALNPFNLDRSFNVQINTALPIASILDPRPAAYSNVTSFTFNFNGSVGGQSLSTFECALDAQAFSACNGGSKQYVQSDLTEGSHTFRVRSVDLTANTRSTEQVYQFTIDRTAPAVSITSPAASAVLTVASTNAAFTVSDTNAATVTRVCRLDNVQLSSCNSPVALNNLSNGPHTFSVTAADGANNSTVVSRSFSVNVPVMVNKTLAWNASVDANNAFDSSVTSYNVYVGTAPGVYNAPISAAAGASPSRALSNLVVGQTYYIAVSAVNVAGESDRSTVLTYVAAQ